MIIEITNKRNKKNILGGTGLWFDVDEHTDGIFLNVFIDGVQVINKMKLKYLPRYTCDGNIIYFTEGE